MEIVGVRFKKAGKIYHFAPEDFTFEIGQEVIAETARGLEYGKVVFSNREIEYTDEYELKPIIRCATDDDKQKHKKNKETEQNAKAIFKEKTDKHGLNMNLTDVELTFDSTKIIFYFTAEGRVDFRELVKELASIFKMRIELRQIGVRDEAKTLNGIGICGRTLCCATFLEAFQPVSIKMAKDQSLSLNPTKISGACGRLMCCLKYEQDVYEELTKNLPRVGDIIRVGGLKGEVLSVNVLRQTIKAAIRKNEQDAPNVEFFNVSEIKIVERRYIKEQDDIYTDELKGIED